MILHLSDLHFGTEQPVLCAALRRLSERLQPEAVVVSGDLTQRARVAQFVQARQFLVSLQRPLLVVPGNHDIPLFEFAERLLQPFGRFRQQFGGLEPTLTTAHFHLVGVNSVSRRQHTRGHFSPWQILEAGARLGQAPAGCVPLLVSHQPFLATEPGDLADVPALMAMAVRHWVQHGARGFLHGHVHQSAVRDLNAALSLGQPQPVLDIQAGTALSTRLRRQHPNSVNTIDAALQVTRYSYDPQRGEFESTGLLWPPPGPAPGSD